MASAKKYMLKCKIETYLRKAKAYQNKALYKKKGKKALELAKLSFEEYKKVANETDYLIIKSIEEDIKTLEAYYEEH